jgi:hypothetical protein
VLQRHDQEELGAQLRHPEIAKTIIWAACALTETT